MSLGKYELDQSVVLGEGGQGVVFHGTTVATKKQVAIKVVDLQKKFAKLCFESECRTSKVLSSKLSNICFIDDIIKTPDLGYLIMKKYDCDLFTFMSSRKSPFTENELKTFFAKICYGVKEIHRKRIAHLDIRPHNILIKLDTMEPYISDFGCAFAPHGNNSNSKRKRETVQSIPSLGFRGTKAFAAPEVFTAKSYDPFRADIYSLGVLLYYLSTHHYPKVKTTFAKTIDISTIKSHVPSPCYKLLLNLLNTNPAERFCIDQVLESPYLCGKVKVSFISRLIHQNTTITGVERSTFSPLDTNDEEIEKSKSVSFNNFNNTERSRIEFI